MMEVFDITIIYLDRQLTAEIKTAFTPGPDPDYEVWIKGKLAFVINLHLDECDAPCWKVKGDRHADLELVRLIGEEIERHYL